MRLIVIAAFLLTGCASWNQAANDKAQWNSAKTFYVFETVNDVRSINAESAKPTEPTQNTPSTNKKGKPGLPVNPPPKKAVAVFPCKPGDNCQPKAEEKKVISYDQFMDHLKKATAANKNIFGQQEKVLARGLASLKERRKFAQSEIAHFDWQIKTYRYASLRPVVENYKQAKVDLTKEIAQIDEKIKKFEKDLQFLHNPNRLRIGMMEPAELLMEMIEGGQWAFGDYLPAEDKVLWNFFQKVGQDLAKN
jgi:hypothetical protein